MMTPLSHLTRLSFAVAGAWILCATVSPAAEEAPFSLKAFVKEIDDAHEAKPATEEKYELFRGIAKEQLARFIHIPDRTILRLVNMGRRLDNYDTHERAKKAGKPIFDKTDIDYPRVFATIDELIPLLEDREWLVARLLADKARELFHMGRLEEAYAVRERQFELSKKITLEVGLATLEDQIDFADMASLTERKEKADKLYAFATIYNYAVVPEPYFQQAVELVIRAARGVINERRGDAERLRHTYLDLGIQRTLKDELNAAYREVGLDRKVE